MVVVLYESAEVIERCVEALPEAVQVALVDNASTDDGLERARALRPDAITVRSERNLGFGVGCNLGWRAATQPIVAFINPDVRVRADTLPRLLERLNEEEHAMIGPALLTVSGVPRLCKAQPSPLRDVLGLLPAAARWAPVGWDGKLDQADLVHARGGPAPSVEGACFVIRRSDLEAIGGFDEDFFLYREEESLALRLSRLGGGAVYEPRALVEHLGGDSTSKDSCFATRHFHRSRVIFYRKRNGDSRGMLIAVAMAGALIVAAAGAAVNAILGRGRETTLEECWYALRGILAGMTARLQSDIAY